MLKTVIPRPGNITAACHLPCVHLNSLSSLWSGKRTSDGVATSAARREMSENAAGAKTPSFQYFWQPGSGYYGESLGRINKSATDLCDDFVLSHIDKETSISLSCSRNDFCAQSIKRLIFGIQPYRFEHCLEALTSVKKTEMAQTECTQQTDLAPVPVSKGVFTIGDYGTCDGSVSLQLINKIIDHLRNKHGPDLKIQIIYEDHSSNDYNSLFKTVYDKASYMSKFTNVFPLACGTGFYKQCVPDNTCDIIVSTFATHYLSEESYVRCSNTIFPWRSTSEEELRAHHEAAARDWQTFLLLRAAELKPGGLLFVSMPAKNKGSKPSQSRSVTVPVTDNVSCTPKETARDVWSNFDLSWNELYAKGIITKEEFQSCTIAMAFRTLQEVKSPFENAIFPVRQAGLNLLKEPEEFFTACYAKTMWRQNLKTHGVDDKKMFAKLLAKGFSVVLNGTLRNTFRNTRSAEKQSAILKEYYECFVQKVAMANPETFQSELFVSRLVAQKLK